MKAGNVIVIGAGPAGLTAGYLLSKRGRAVTVLEADPEYVGGISRTVRYRGFSFDIGGHRFFSKSAEVEALWTELLPDDLLDRPRISRIHYGGKFYSYPLQAGEALRNLGFRQSAACLLSYLKARLLPIRNPRSFEDWVTNQFGARLFEIFFRTYTEKVWGMKCSEISADWAAQRIRGLSLSRAALNALRWDRSFSSPGTVKTLITRFRYPRKGPGMLWESCARRMAGNGGRLEMGRTVVSCRHRPADGCWSVVAKDAGGNLHEYEAAEVISTAPLREIALGLEPRPPEAALRAAAALRYRDFLTVALIVRDRSKFRDNWIYVHDPGVKVGRIQNFKAWSPEMVPDPELACYGLEYFCFEGDGLWEAPDPELVRLAASEMAALGLIEAGDLLDGCVVRQKKAYPVYDEGYRGNVAVIRSALEQGYPGLHVIGRNGMHKYNNQDHSMMTAMLCVENILAGRRVYDVWNVNEDAEYHETGEAGSSGLRSVPESKKA